MPISNNCLLGGGLLTSYEMVCPPEHNPLEDNPIKLLTHAEVSEYYEKHTFDFTSQLDTTNTTHDPLETQLTTEEQFEGHFWRLRVLTEDVNRASANCKDEWDKHTDLIHDYFRNPFLLQNYFICKNKAFLKLCEILEVLETEVIQRESFRSFHLCEGPGYFIEATFAAWLRQRNSKYGAWQWAANTLNPYFENIQPIHKLIDDSHIRGHMGNWVFGPSDDGDVVKLTDDYLAKSGFAGTFDLVTADGSTNTVGFENVVDDKVWEIISAEIRVALTLLRSGGRLVIKVYRFTNKHTRDAVRLLADHFSSIQAIKPMASRPGSLEKYLVCDGFGGKCTIDDQMMADCDLFFLRLQAARIRMHLHTFDRKVANYTFEQKQQFLQAMRPKLFTSQSAENLRDLRTLFPVGHSRAPSPWSDFYPNNMIRRFQGPLMQNAIMDYLNTANIYDPDKYPLDIESTVKKIADRENLLITSDIVLNTQDTLFVEARAYYAILNYERPNVYYDLFERVSTINFVPDTTWRQSLDISTSDVEITVDQGITIEHIITAIDEGLDKNMTSFTINKLATDVPPLYVSRLSASMFVLFYMIFERCDYSNGQVKWSGQKFIHYDSVRYLVKRLRSEIATLSPRTSVRSFVGLRTLDAFHSRISYRNVAHITTARHYIQRTPLPYVPI